MSKLTDAELINRTLDGDIKAFGVLVQRYQDAVYAAALHYTMNFADAQDVSQEAFIDAYRNLHKLSEPAKFPSWLHTITIRQCHRLRRKQHEATSLEEIGDIEMVRISREKMPLPHEEIERNEFRHKVLDAIASLPQEMGEVVTMHYIDGLSYNDIASFLSVPASTVKGRLQMGRKRLKEELLTMVEDILKENRPDERFTEKVLNEIIEQTKSARERKAHDEVIQLCEKALEVLEHLEENQEHQRTQINVLNWHSDELLGWLGKPEEAMKNFENAVQIASKLDDHELLAKALMMQAVAFSRMGNFKAMLKPIQRSRSIYVKLGETKSQIVCDAVADLVKLLPRDWERVDVPPELRTGYGIHRFSLLQSEKALTLIHEGKGRPWCETVIPYYMHRGYGMYRDESLLSLMAQPTQILSYPLNIGYSWSNQIETKRGENLSVTQTIESDEDTVVVPAGRFENCLRITTIISEPADADFSDLMETFIRASQCGKIDMWFAKGIGLVKYRHESHVDNTIQLIEYQTNENKIGDYYPLKVGNYWKYERYIDWCRTRYTESYRVTQKEGEIIHLSCAMYSDLLDDNEQLEYFQKWLNNEKSSADFHGITRMYSRIGDVYARLGKWDLMKDAYQQMDEFIEQTGDVKLGINLWLNALDGNQNTSWNPELEIVMEKSKQALQTAEEIGEKGELRRGFDIMPRFCILHDKLGDALTFAQKAYPIAIQDNNFEHQVYLEAQMDMIKAWLAGVGQGHTFLGGTYFAHSWKVSESEIAFGKEFGGYIHKIFPEGRPYPPIYTDFIQIPLPRTDITAGRSWSQTRHDGLTDVLIEADNESVDVPAGKFDRCVKFRLKTQLMSASEGSSESDEIFNQKKGFFEGTKSIWFASGTGIVKSEHHHANGKRTVVELTNCHMSIENDDYFPISTGNQWNYEWRDENGDLIFMEQIRVVNERKGESYMACSGYTTSTSEYRTSI